MLRNIIVQTAPSFLKPFLRFGHNVPKLFLIPLISLILFVLGFNLFFWNKIHPGIHVAGNDLSGLTQEEAVRVLSNISEPSQIDLKFEDRNFVIKNEDLNISYNPEASSKLAFEYTRGDRLDTNIINIWQAITQGINIGLSFNINNEALSNNLDDVTKEINIPYSEPEISIVKEQVNILTGSNGQEVDKIDLRKQIIDLISFNRDQTINIPVEKITPQLTDSDVADLKTKAQKIVGKKLVLTHEYDSFAYLDAELVVFLKPEGKSIKANEEKTKTIISDLSKAINRDPQDARFVFEENRVKEFQPAKDGIAVEEEKLLDEIYKAISNLSNEEKREITISIPVFATKPAIDNAAVNDLGIKELIGRGESLYKGSIPSRVHNLSLAASRLNGVLIKPGEEFSFNKTVGEISVLTGYQQAYVIKEGRTILDDGGGVCQTSTTFFRAALASGLPILERHQHSYRVSYYEQGTKAGIDAAIYQPGVDLRLKNDTPGHILIQTKNDPANSKLIFEFYGTSDGRVVEISEPKHWDAQPAPPPLYQDDPTLPIGQEKQIEKAVPGLKTSFTYKVTRSGEVLQNKTFYSNYRAWQAVYLRGTMVQ